MSPAGRLAAAKLVGYCGTLAAKRCRILRVPVREADGTFSVKHLEFSSEASVIFPRSFGDDVVAPLFGARMGLWPVFEDGSVHVCRCLESHCGWPTTEVKINLDDFVF
jgi:hypothetical protein